MKSRHQRIALILGGLAILGLIVALVLNAFQSMKNQPSYRQYDLEALKKKYETYKPLIERTLSLSK